MAAVSAEQKIAIPGGNALFHGMPGRLKVLYISTAGRTGRMAGGGLCCR